ncbi:MAG: ADP-ribosylglycohydrolase family protein [Eubacteriales bacterium]|nr:ADP-ribosylglycohydrolase family protein [Eubacteriales bacterium]
MLGAIVGDIVGSRFEFNNHKSKDFELFGEGCFATDDSIITLAVAKAIMEASKAKAPDSHSDDHDFNTTLSNLTVKYMQEIGRKYPNCGFGGMFNQWVFSDNPEPYNSFGNGAAMRVSPTGFAATSEWDAERLAETVTEVTHNHDEGIKGAKATAVAIVMARHGALKSEIRDRIVAEYYPLDFRINDIRYTYRFNETCQETVPQAIECFLESTSFEDAIRTAISLGGDSDTIAAITGAIAEAYYGVPDDVKAKALEYLDEELRTIYNTWERFAPTDGEQFKVLTKYIGKISAAASLGEWIIDTENDGTPEHPMHFPFVNYNILVSDFREEFYQFSETHPEYELTRYGEILEKNGLKWGEKEMRSADLQSLDEQGVLALIMGAIRAERFCDGALLGFLKDGSLVVWLKRLKDIDWQRKERKIQSIEFEDGGFFGGFTTYRLIFNAGGAELTQSPSLIESSPLDKTQYSVDELTALRERFAAIHTEYWNTEYPNPCVCDGEQWSMTVRYSDGYTLSCSGSNAYPENWKVLLDFFGIDYDDEDDEVKRQPGELIYCSVSLDGGKTYYYTTEDEPIEIGDMVVVPVGADNTELTGEVDDIDYIGFAETQDDEQQFLVVKDSSRIDVLDENLYSYDSIVFALTPAVQHRTSEGLINKVKQFVDSVPAAQKAKDYVRSKTEYTPRLDLIPDEIQQALQNGTAEIIPCKDSANAFYLQIRTTIKGLVINGKEYGKNRKIKDIPIGTKQVPTDVAGAMQCLALQNQLNQIANGLREISEACEFNFGRVIQGQRDDRLAKLLSSRSNFIQALAISDESLQKQMLLQAIRDANSARAELAFQIKSDILLLGGEKSPKSTDMTKMVSDINKAIVAMNNAVQLSLYSYQALGERAAQLAVVKEHETFIKQVLLKKIDYNGSKHPAWKLICSSGNSKLAPRNVGELPAKLIESCTAFIEGNSESATNLLEGKSNG